MTPRTSERRDTVAFVGGGQMASALITGLRRSGWTGDDIFVIESNAEQRTRLESAFGVRAFPGAPQDLARASAVVWAVKPQDLKSAMDAALGRLCDPLHISIAAGVTTATLAQWAASERVIRVMPNMPALVGAGLAGMFAGAGVLSADRELAGTIMGSVGSTFWVESEERIDAVTAISGSGPGYVFSFLHDFQMAAQMLGFSEEESRQMVLRTASGAVQQASASSERFDQLRDRVASKGGTTQAALEVMAQHNFPTVLKLAIACAYERAQQIAAGFDRQDRPEESQ